MADPVTGANTTCVVGTSQNVAKVRKYDHKSARDETESGPWFGEPDKSITIGGKLGTLDLEGDIPIGGDAGIDDIRDAYETGTKPQLALATVDGYNITYTSPSYTAFDITTEANGTQTWKATVKGAYTIVQDT